jgi:hypothetical protein
MLQGAFFVFSRWLNMAGLSAPTEMIAALFFVVFLFFPQKNVRAMLF